MSTNKVTREAKYIYAEVRGNNNKYWQIEELSDGSCHVRWGRVGADGQTQTKSFNSQYEASRFFDSKCREKEAKGYEKLKVINGQSSITHTSTNSLIDIASKQIETDSPQTLELVKRLAKANIHSILTATTMSYDTSRGTFSTPLGIVTQEAIDDARATLNQMGNFVERRDFNNRSYLNLLNHFLKLVPQKINGRLEPTIYSDLKAIQKQNDVLDSLEASLKLVVTNSSNDNNVQVGRIFEAKLYQVEDGRIIDELRKLYRATRQNMHACHTLDVLRVYHIEIGSMKNAFETSGKKIGNVMDLWHGTKTGNLLSILKTGFIIPPASANFCTGRMYGNGIYHSDQSTKALNYSSGYWQGGKENNCFMLLNEVAMGKSYTPRSSSERFPKPGFDSTFAKAGQSGVYNNEMIVYNPKQINPKYLIEFSVKGQ